MKRVILMHGKDTSPSEKWYPWLKAALANFGINLEVPVLPEPNVPVLDDWVTELDALEPDENTVLIGHSRGGVAVLRYLERLSEGRKVKKVILIAANSGLLSKRHILNESNHGFYTESGYDFEKIKQHCDEFIVFHSKDDKWVPFEAGVENADGLDADFKVFEDKAHFGKNISKFDELVREI